MPQIAAMDVVVALDEQHLRQLVKPYAHHYNRRLLTLQRRDELNEHQDSYARRCFRQFLRHEIRGQPGIPLARVDFAPHGHVPCTMDHDFNSAVDHIENSREREHTLLASESLVKSGGGLMRDLMTGPFPLPVIQ